MSRRSDPAARPSPPEFSRLLPVEPGMGAGADARRFTIEADAKERAALARRFDLLDLPALSAKGSLEVFDKGRRARLSATLTADVVQACVVTLAPVPAHVEETFTVAYDRRGAAPEAVDFDPLADDLPDPLPAAGVDVGEAVAEHLGLALDPYPRAPGARLKEGEAPKAARETPFSVLRRLKDR